MNAPVPSGVAGFLARYDTLRDRLPGDVRQRDAAVEAFCRSGLPGATSGRREEAWKYTSLRALADASFSQSLTQAGDREILPALPRIEAPCIVFVDGRYRAELSTLPALLSFASFGEAPDFGTLARPDREPLVALNTMLAEDGAVLSVPAGVDAGMHSALR